MEPYARKIFHAKGVLIVGLYWWIPIDQFVLATILGAIALVMATFDLVRARNPAVQAWFFAKFGKITAEKDRKGWNGTTLYMTGCAITVALFSRDLASAGILCLALGDSSAAIVGMSVRSPQWRNASVAGSGTCLLVCTASCWPFVGFPAALMGGVTATFIEAFGGAKLDNLLIAVGTAGALLLVIA